MEDILKGAYAYAEPFTKDGKLVDYIPALAKADKNKLAASIIDEDGNVYEIGDVDIKFSMMSIVKVILYLIALENYEFDEITNLIGLKGSSKPYNSLLDLEMSNDKKPVNPFINAGALVTSYLIYNKFKENSVDVILDKIRLLAGNDSIDYDRSIIEAGKGGGQANKAIIYSLQNNNVIPKDIDVMEVLDIYGIACAVMVDTKDLAAISYVLSTGGYNNKNEKLMDKEHARILRTLMAVCGTYDYAGDFAVEIGLPAKSGVGGGIMATTNKKIGLATYCPGLDPRGNSVVGIKLLEYISEKLELGIY